MSTSRFLFVASLALLAVTCGTYSGALFNDFVQYDDNIYVMFNPQTKGGLSWTGFHYAWTTFDSGNWIPLTWLSYQLDATVWRMSPMGFHATNLVLHSANVLLLFLWLVRTTSSHWRSFTVALLFAIHPLHVESVAWVAERKDVLSTFFLLVSLSAYTMYAHRPGLKWYAVSLAAFALGLLSKSMIVTLPILFFLVDFWPLQRWIGGRSIDEKQKNSPKQTTFWLIAEKLPFFLLSLLDGIMTILAATSSKSFAKVTFINRLGNCLQSYGWYVVKTIVPTNLCVLYPHPLDHLDWIQVGLYGSVVVAISVYVAMQFSRHPELLTGWLWFLISLLPVIGLLQVGAQSHADRYSYIPHIGLLILIVWMCSGMVARSRSSWAIGVISVTISVLILMTLTVQQVSVWKSTESLWKHAIAIDADNWYAHGALATICLEADQFEDATNHFQVVEKHHPEDKESNRKLVELYRKYPGKQRASWRFFNELGRYHAEEKNMSFAAVAFGQALSLATDNVNVRNNLAVALSQLGRDQEAQSHFEKVLLVKPDDINAHVNLGVLLQKSKKLKDARKHFLAALQIRPQDQDARERLKALEKELDPE